MLIRLFVIRLFFNEDRASRIIETRLYYHFAIQKDGDIFEYRRPLKDKAPEAVLDPNHTAFICCDDGTVNKYGTELDFRTKFEQFVKEEGEPFYFKILYS